MTETGEIQWLKEQVPKVLKRLDALEFTNRTEIEKRFMDLEIGLKELKDFGSRIEGIGSSVTQYASVIDQMKEQVTKLPAEILGQVDKALKEGSKQIVEASKLYVDQRLGGQTVQPIPVTGNTMGLAPAASNPAGQGWGRLGEQLSQRIPDIIEKGLNRFLLGESSPQGLSINPNLAGRVNRAIEKMATRNMEEFAMGLEKKLGLTSESAGPVTGVTHS